MAASAVEKNRGGWKVQGRVGSAILNQMIREVPIGKMIFE